MSKKHTIQSALKRIQEEITIDENDCWLWRGALGGSKGYPCMKIGGKLYILHRKMHEWFNGPIAPDNQVHHKCETKRCINPAHLEATAFHSTKHRKTHCIKGHEYTEENTVYFDGIYRYCKTCNKERNRVYREKIRREKKCLS